MNKQNANLSIDKKRIINQLYKIRNVANLAVLVPNEKVDVYEIQDVISIISDIAQNIIEEVEV